MADMFEDAPSTVAAVLGAVSNGSGANGTSSLYHLPQPPHKRLVVRAAGPEGHPFYEIGQVAKVLLALVDAGERGVTPLARETWALRLSDHVRKLKNRRGLSIITLWGKHDDGRHARYVLRSTVTILEIVSD